jgi:hypothetical protein
MFTEFSKAVSAQIASMKTGMWLEVDVPKEELWALYLSSFPPGTNPIYRERTEHDCVCCRHFIRDIGSMVSLRNGVLQTVWDVAVPAPYQTVADALAKRVRAAAISGLYTHVGEGVGNQRTLQQLEDGSFKKWDHFYGVVPKELVKISGEKLGEAASTVAVMRRGFEEITDDAIDTVLELINQKSLYRGDEFKASLEAFKTYKKKYKDAPSKEIFLWENCKWMGGRIRNTAIGTLLQDISEGSMELDAAVRAFEAKVAPSNYRRPSPIITKRMVEDALRVIREEDLEDSLKRRFAVVEDISVNDILFADRSVRSAMRDSLKDALLSGVVEAPKNFSKVTEIPIEQFIKDVLPSVTSMEVQLENEHEPNLVSVVAPAVVGAKSLFRWGNGFSWSYKGNVADSIKERVKAAGGDVEGYMRVSLSWFNYDDLDLHVFEPMSKAGNGNGERIYFGHRQSYTTGGQLDVDMNAGGGSSRTPVENITWAQRTKMLKGTYVVVVNNFNKRESIDVGFEVEVECCGALYNFKYDKPVRDKQDVRVVALTFDGTRITEVQSASNIEVGSRSRTFWGIDTNKFHKVSLMTLSPNHWHGASDGNKHYIFVLDGCKNPEPVRGFYNEFLPSSLSKYKRVFEVLGDKMKCEPTDRQLSGLGFSSTKRQALLCKVSGKVDRMLRITF